MVDDNDNDDHDDYDDDDGNDGTDNDDDDDDDDSFVANMELITIWWRQCTGGHPPSQASKPPGAVLQKILPPTILMQGM